MEGLLLGCFIVYRSYLFTSVQEDTGGKREHYLQQGVGAWGATG